MGIDELLSTYFDAIRSFKDEHLLFRMALLVYTNRSTITNYVFIVGCPRSGTTFLQTLLAAHSSIFSLPETRFFYYLTPTKEWDSWWRRVLPVVSSKQKKSLEFLFSKSLQRPDLYERMPWHWPTKGRMWKAFHTTIEELIMTTGSEIFLEKTPEHIYRIKHIGELLPQAQFVHVIRDGLSVVNSLLSVTREHPFNWGGEWTIDYCIQRWNEAAALTAQHANQPNHMVVGYNQLLNNPSEVLKSICVFLGIAYEDSMIAKAPSMAVSLAPNIEPHKQQNRLPYSELRKRPMTLSKELQEYIERKLVVPESLRLFVG